MYKTKEEALCRIVNELKKYKPNYELISNLQHTEYWDIDNDEIYMEMKRQKLA